MEPCRPPQTPRRASIDSHNKRTGAKCGKTALENPSETAGASSANGYSTPCEAPSTPLAMAEAPDTLGASPSPMLLNPLTSIDWLETSTRHSLPDLNPSDFNQNETQQLQMGHRLKMLDEDSQSEHLCVLDFLEEVSSLRITPIPDDDEFAYIYIPLERIHRLETGKLCVSTLSKRFSLVMLDEDDDPVPFHFEAESVIQRESVCSTLLDVWRRSGKSDIVSTGKVHTAVPDLKLSLPRSRKKQKGKKPSNFVVQLSPMKRTCIHNRNTVQQFREDEEPFEEGLETSLVYSDDEGDGIASLRQSFETSFDLEQSFDENIFRRHGNGAAFVVPELDETSIGTSSNEEKLNVEGEFENDDFKPHESLASNQEVSSPNQWLSENMCLHALTSWSEFFFPTDDNEGPQMCADVRNTYSCSKDTSISQNQVALQNYIAEILGTPSIMPTFFSEDMWSVGRTLRQRASDKSLEANNRFRNRSGVMLAQAMRMSRLQQQMTFDGALEGSRRKMRHLQISKSMDYADYGNDDVADKAASTVFNPFEAKTKHKKESVEGALPLHPLQTFIENIMSDDGEDEDQEEYYYYDSDTEGARLHHTRKGPRWILAERLNEFEDIKAILPTEVDQDLTESFEEGLEIDKECIDDLLEEIKGETLTLLWHPTQSRDNVNRVPTCVNLWFERGSTLYNSQHPIQPKLMWSAAHERHLHAKVLNVSVESPDIIDLLDISRILNVRHIDRRLHPFADLRKSFIVETRSQPFLFEAQTVAERDRIVVGLKMIVARLASLLMTKDYRVMDEFFGSPLAEVPGEAPEWASGNPDDHEEFVP